MAERNDAARLIPVIYDRLRRLAARYLEDERPGHTLQPTALVHEAFIRLAALERVEWKSRTHLYAMAATEMRRVLIEHARAASSRKRGSRPRRVTLADQAALTGGPSIELLALDEALTRLAERSPRQGRVAELKLFAGLAVPEMAAVLEVSERTIKGDWRMARAWLMHQLEAGGPE